MVETQEITGNTTAEDLIERFENDIRYDAHQLMTRLGRSKARKEIERRGKELAPFISQRITELSNTEKNEVDDEVISALRLILKWIS
jgi:hypothetical protein